MFRAGAVGIVLGALVVLTGSAVPPEDIGQDRHAGQPDSRMADAVTVARPGRDMSVRDVAEMRQVSESVASPNGREVAMVVTEPVTATNQVTSRVLITDTAHALKSRTVAAEADTRSRISNLRWSPDGRSLSYLSARGGADEIWSVAATGGRVSRVLGDLDQRLMIGGAEYLPHSTIPPHPAKVLAFDWSPDGRYLAYTTPQLIKRAAVDDGVVYDDRAMTMPDLVKTQFDTYATRLWIRDGRTGQSRRVADLDLPKSSLGFGGLRWSPDSSKLAVSRLAGRDLKNGGVQLVLEVVDRVSAGVTIAATENVVNAQPVWSPDGSLVLGQRGRQLVGLPAAGGSPVPVAELPVEASGSFRQVWWSADGKTVAADIFGRSREFIYAGSRGGVLAPVAGGTDDLSTCAARSTLGRAVCVRQNISTPPQVVTVDLGNKVIGTGMDLNPGLRGVRIVAPQPRRWTNSYGTIATGYEIVPVTCRNGVRCPVVVITHGVDARNKFMDQGLEWEYPSQVFAARGYVVLLVNETKFPVPDLPWEESKLRLGLDAVATMQQAVEDAVNAGYADPSKAGIMGYSHGFQTGQLAISHGKTFAAASLANGSDGNATYWLAGRQELREYWTSMYGGNPVDPKSRAHWQELDPAMNADKIDAPLLMQFTELEALIGLQTYSYLRDRNRPVELQIFPDANHLFYQPRHRVGAMTLNLDWFDYWLLGRKDPSRAKSAQYARWDAMHR